MAIVRVPFEAGNADALSFFVEAFNHSRELGQDCGILVEVLGVSQEALFVSARVASKSLRIAGKARVNILNTCIPESPLECSPGEAGLVAPGRLSYVD